ncbi:MAG TPA: NUDIX domain-containing protein [Ktedonobacteraceae bacterium]|nr:NUDIX domain-containing protein [Ktedonobacteraceae bacterium]
MYKQAFVLSREALVESGFIPEHIRGEAAYYTFQGKEDLERLLALAEQHGAYRERGGENDVERDPTVQQVIVYGYIRRADGRFMLYQRGSKDYDEKRLAEKVSLGVGGHMEPTDLSLMDAFYRELAEETVVTANGQAMNFRRADGTTNIELMQQYITVEPVGVIKDERDDVGKVHVGIACRLTPGENVDVSIRSDNGENVRSFYVTPSEYDTLEQSGEIAPEGWTSLVVDNELRIGLS